MTNPNVKAKPATALLEVSYDERGVMYVREQGDTRPGFPVMNSRRISTKLKYAEIAQRHNAYPALVAALREAMFDAGVSADLVRKIQDTLYPLGEIE